MDAPTVFRSKPSASGTRAIIDNIASGDTALIPVALFSIINHRA